MGRAWQDQIVSAPCNITQLGPRRSTFKMAYSKLVLPIGKELNWGYRPSFSPCEPLHGLLWLPYSMVAGFGWILRASPPGNYTDCEPVFMAYLQKSQNHHFCYSHNSVRGEGNFHHLLMGKLSVALQE